MEVTSSQKLTSTRARAVLVQSGFRFYCYYDALASQLDVPIDTRNLHKSAALIANGDFEHALEECLEYWIKNNDGHSWEMLLMAVENIERFGEQPHITTVTKKMRKILQLEDKQIATKESVVRKGCCITPVAEGCLPNHYTTTVKPADDVALQISIIDLPSRMTEKSMPQHFYDNPIKIEFEQRRFTTTAVDKNSYSFSSLTPDQKLTACISISAPLYSDINLMISVKELIGEEESYVRKRSDNSFQFVEQTFQVDLCFFKPNVKYFVKIVSQVKIAGSLQFYCHSCCIQVQTCNQFELTSEFGVFIEKSEPLSGKKYDNLTENFTRLGLAANFDQMTEKVKELDGQNTPADIKAIANIFLHSSLILLKSGNDTLISPTEIFKPTLDLASKSSNSSLLTGLTHCHIASFFLNTDQVDKAEQHTGCATFAFLYLKQCKEMSTVHNTRAKIALYKAHFNLTKDTKKEALNCLDISAQHRKHAEDYWSICLYSHNLICLAMLHLNIPLTWLEQGHPFRSEKPNEEDLKGAKLRLDSIPQEFIQAQHLSWYKRNYHLALAIYYRILGKASLSEKNRILFNEIVPGGRACSTFDELVKNIPWYAEIENEQQQPSVDDEDEEYPQWASVFDD